MARILIADDALFMRSMVKKALIEGGHDVIGEAENGAVAVELFGKLSPDVVTLDITMPELDGLGALQAIMQADASARVIMCTALGQQEKVREALALGAKDFVVKPFTAPKLLEAVSRALAS